MYCFEILILTYSDFTFDNVNFDLRKRSGFKYILQLLNICLVSKYIFLVVHNVFINYFIFFPISLLSSQLLNTLLNSLKD